MRGNLKISNLLEKRKTSDDILKCRVICHSLEKKDMQHLAFE